MTFCKLIDGINTFGSRGIINSMGESFFVWIETSFPNRSSIENEIDLERFVLDGVRDWSAIANGWINNYQRSKARLLIT